MKSTHRTLWLACGLCLALLVGCGDAAPDASVDAPDALGAFAVGHTSFSEARGDRPLLIDVWYPVDAEDAQDGPLAQYPLLGPIGLASEVAVDDLPVSARGDQTLVVFSHGYGGIHIQSVELMETLASHGFIAASVEHTGNAQSSAADTFDEAAANRVPDVSFVIDTMIARNRDTSDPFFERIDEQRVGALGHSFGGMTAIGMAAGWAGAEPDPRVAAIAPISAVIDGDMQSDKRQGPNAGFTEDQLSRIVVPVMLIGGTEDITVPIGNNAIAFEQVINAPRVYKADIIGANHTHFANVCDIGNLLLERGLEQERWPDLAAADLIEPYNTTCSADAFPIDEATRLQNLYVVSFFKRHLLDQGEYDRYLTEDFADTEPAIAFSVK